MSSTKFTPGPWFMAVESGTFVYALGPNKTNSFWCDVQFAGKERITKEEANANANLIAAAPNMYEALRCLRDGEGLPPGTTIDDVLAEARGKGDA